MGRPRTGRGPIRSCRVCRTKAAKLELERWVWRDGQLILDSRQQEPGRGWYSCKQADCSRRVGLIAKSMAQRTKQPKNSLDKRKDALA